MSEEAGSTTAAPPRTSTASVTPAGLTRVFTIAVKPTLTATSVRTIVPKPASSNDTR
jgi:hypothetical protein